MPNIYNFFRSVGKSANRGEISKRFDEPTFISFKLIFGDSLDSMYNTASYSTSYDIMPHPLFNISEYKNVPLGDVEGYSALRYLTDANEFTRVAMLKEFIYKFNDLQLFYPYYFQSISGVQELLNVDPKKGIRISDDKKITITCLEGLDQRMSYLLNLYKKIVWDDIYQRWVLPDMMRYFTLKIYLTEYRSFHGSAINETANPDFLQTTTLKNSGPMFLKVLDDILPVWEITCEMCEFDITDISFESLSSLSVNNEPTSASVKFSVKVGNIKETQMYPMFTQGFLNDRKLNGPNRSNINETTTKFSDSTPNYEAKLQIAQERISNPNSVHQSGNALNDQFYNDKSGQPISKPINETEPNTWIGNALDFGTSYTKNLVETYADKAKITKIPGLGVSYSELSAALESKDIISTLGIIRKGVNEVVEHFKADPPSGRLNKTLETDKIMIDFIKTMVKSTKSDATDDESAKLAIQIKEGLNGETLYDFYSKVIDRSLATDIDGVPTLDDDTMRNLNDQASDISNATDLGGDVNFANETGFIEKPKDRSIATDLDGNPIFHNTNNSFIEAIPSSMLNELELYKLDQPKPSEATNSNLIL